MRYAFLSAAVLALVSSVQAQLAATDGFDVFTSPAEGAKIVAGKPFDITWQPGTKPEYLNGTATIALLQGKDRGSLGVGRTIVAGVKNSAGKYTWDVPSDAVGFALYGLRITLDDDKSTAQNEATIFQYSFPFQITSADGSSSSPGGTTTIVLGTGSNYTPTPTPSSTLTSSTAHNTTSTVVVVTTPSAAVTQSSNLTATRTLTTSRSTGTTGASTSQTANAAVGNVVSGTLALVGGVVLAFAM